LYLLDSPLPPHEFVVFPSHLLQPLLPPVPHGFFFFRLCPLPTITNPHVLGLSSGPMLRAHLSPPGRPLFYSPFHLHVSRTFLHFPRLFFFCVFPSPPSSHQRPPRRPTPLDPFWLKCASALPPHHGIASVPDFPIFFFRTRQWASHSSPHLPLNGANPPTVPFHPPFSLLFPTFFLLCRRSNKTCENPVVSAGGDNSSNSA